MSEHEEGLDEGALWKFAGIGIVIAIVLWAVLGFVVLAVSGAGLDLVPQLGASLFIGFWGGPVFGMAGAIGYYELVYAKRRHSTTS
jgi:hypothetical protein